MSDSRWFGNRDPLGPNYSQWQSRQIIVTFGNTIIELLESYINFGHAGAEVRSAVVLMDPLGGSFI